MSSRGKNFTEREKCKLLELIQKYKYIIENKCTNRTTTIQKNEAWDSITAEFNSTSEVPRHKKQLNTAYLNIKRSTRQNVASEIVKKYIDQKPYIIDIECEVGPTETITDERNIQDDTVDTKCHLKQYKEDEIADKNSVANEGGVYNTQMLTITDDEVNPLSNDSDSASSYFKNADVHDSPPSKLERNMKRKKKKVQSNELMKKLYYQKKLQCVILEKKTKLVEYKTALKQQKLLDLTIKIKEKEYESLIK